MAANSRWNQSTLEFDLLTRTGPDALEERQTCAGVRPDGLPRRRSAQIAPADRPQACWKACKGEMGRQSTLMGVLCEQTQGAAGCIEVCNWRVRSPVGQMLSNYNRTSGSEAAQRSSSSSLSKQVRLKALRPVGMILARWGLSDPDASHRPALHDSDAYARRGKHGPRSLCW